MSELPKQTKHKDFEKRLRKLGWEGPFPGKGKHPRFMTLPGRMLPLKLPNKHGDDIGEVLLKKLLAEAGISINEWLGRPEPEHDESPPTS